MATILKHNKQSRTTLYSFSTIVRNYSLLMCVIMKVVILGAFLYENNVHGFHSPQYFVKCTSTRGPIKDECQRKTHILLLQALQAGDDTHHPEIQLDLEGTVTPAAGSSSITPPRRKKHENRKRRKRVKMQRNAGMKSGPCTEDELALHVISEYVSGRGGIFNQIDARRRREEASGLFRENSVESNKEQVDYLKKLDRHPALVLNADYQPLSVLPLSLWSWQETMKALFSGKVVVVDVYQGITIKAVNLNVPLPSVIALTEYVPQPNQKPAFTRRNVFLRDSYKCQYCSKLYRTHDLSLDHVTPKCVGGKLEWENTVTSCKKCNAQKGSTLPNALRSVGMKLLRQPKVPTKYELAANASKMVPRRVHPSWKPFLHIDSKDGGDEDSLDEYVEMDSRKYLDGTW